MSNTRLLLACLFAVATAQFSAQTCTGNLLQNPGFESGLANWEGTGGEIGAAPNVASGSKSLKMCTSGTSIRQTLPATVGKNYKFQYTAKTAGTGQNILFSLKFLSATWQPLASEFSSFDSPTAFSTNFIQKTAPAGAVWVEIGIVKQNAGCVYVDDLCLTDGSATGGGSAITVNCPADISDSQCHQSGGQGNSCPNRVGFSYPTATTTCPSGGVTVVLDSIQKSVMVSTETGVLNTPTGCGNAIVGFGSARFFFTIKDACGNSKTCNFRVSNTEILNNPTINCPSDITVVASAGAMGATVNYPIPSINGQCFGGSPALVEGLSLGSVFPIGTTKVLHNFLTSSQSGGQIIVGSCTFMVTVNAPASGGSCANNLLKNAGFGAGLQNWDGTGGQVVAGALELCQNGQSRRQTLPAAVGKNYRFQWSAKTAGAGQNVLFGLHFLSATWQPLGTEWSNFDSPGAFSTNFIQKTAPAGAVWVEALVIKQNAGCVQVEDLCLSDGAVVPPPATTSCQKELIDGGINYAERLSNGQFKIYSGTSDNTMSKISLFDENGNLISSQNYPSVATDYVIDNGFIINKQTQTTTAKLPILLTNAYDLTFVDKKENGTVGWYLAGFKKNSTDSVYILETNNALQIVSIQKLKTNGFSITQLLATTFGYFFCIASPHPNQGYFTEIVINKGANGIEQLSQHTQDGKMEVLAGVENGFILRDFTLIFTSSQNSSTQSNSSSKQYFIYQNNVGLVETRRDLQNAYIAQSAPLGGNPGSFFSSSSCSSSSGGITISCSDIANVASVSGVPNITEIPSVTLNGFGFLTSDGGLVVWGGQGTDFFKSNCTTSSAPALTVTLTTPNPNLGIWKNAPITLTVKNNGTAMAKGVKGQFVNQSEAAVSSKIAYVSHTAAAGTTFNSWFGDWEIGDLAAGESKTLLYNGFTRTTDPILIAAIFSGNPPVVSTTASLTLNPTSLLGSDGRTVVSPHETTDFSVFPNPTDAFATLNLGLFLNKKLQVSVINSLGKTVFSEKMAELNTPEFDLDLSNESNGVYFIKIAAEGQRQVVKRLIISKL